jgi:glycosyltransferase involved in cell wall biosynthesis
LTRDHRFDAVTASGTQDVATHDSATRRRLEEDSAVESGVRLPRVSVGVAVYNGEEFVAETLEALLAQTFSDLEVVISDNASTDRTAEICQTFVARDPRVRYFRSETNRGAAWNHNRVFELARGEFFKWNSADDVCAPTFISRCVEALDNDPAAVMACSDVLQINAKGEPLATQLIPEATMSGPVVTRFRRNCELDHLCVHIYGVIRSSVLRKTDLIGAYTDSDRVLLAHLALYGHFVLIRETLSLNRHHPRRSTEQYVGWRGRAAWFDPAKAHQRTFPFWTEFACFWNTIGRSPLTRADRMRCYVVMLQWAWRYKTYLIYEDLLYYPRQFLVRNVPGARTAWTRLKALWMRRQPAVRDVGRG